MFAIMAAGGDIGASVGPWMVSLIADAAGIISEQVGLRLGILVAMVFPFLACSCLIWMKGRASKPAFAFP